MSGIFLYEKDVKIIVNKTCVTYVMVKAILRTKRIIFHESNTIQMDQFCKMLGVLVT